MTASAIFALSAVCRADATNTVAQATTTNTLFFTVSNQVRKPGTYAWTNGMTLTKAIEMAGGTKQTNPKVYIFRDVGGFAPETKVYNDPLRTKGRDRATFYLGAIRAGAAKDPEIKNGDLIDVVLHMI